MKDLALVNKILSGELMSREDQNDTYQQYQDFSWGDERTPIPDHLHIFYMFYQYEDYSGYGYVWGYDESTDNFFYNSGSHCSCYGLEGQWDMDPYTYEEMVAVTQKKIESMSEKDYYDYGRGEDDKSVKDFHKLLTENV